MCSRTINSTQKEKLIEFVQQHEHLGRGSFSSNFTHKNARNLWEDIAGQLNNIEGGANKNWKQWRKTWQDIKKNVKSKHSLQKRNQNATDGGPMAPNNLHDSDRQVLDLIAPVSLEGDNLKEESEAIFMFDYNLNESEENPIGSPLNMEVVVDEKNTNMEPEINTMEGRVSKTKRWTNSLGMTKKMLPLETVKMKKTEAYRAEKLQLLKKQNLLLAGILEELKKRD